MGELRAPSWGEDSPWRLDDDGAKMRRRLHLLVESTGGILAPKLLPPNMNNSSQSLQNGDQDIAFGVAVPGLRNYVEAHRVRGMPAVHDLDLKRDCTRLILYNVQSYTTAQIWRELRGCLGHMVDQIVKIKHVSGLN